MKRRCIGVELKDDLAEYVSEKFTPKQLVTDVNIICADSASELAKEGITVNAICPGYFDTELTHDTLITEDFKRFMETAVPMRRYGKEGELNAGAIFLASQEASYVTGIILPIDGGYTCV